MGVEAARAGTPYHLKNATNDALSKVVTATEGEYHPYVAKYDEPVMVDRLLKNGTTISVELKDNGPSRSQAFRDTNENKTNPANMIKYENATLPEKEGIPNRVQWAHQRTDKDPYQPLAISPTIRGGVYGGRGIDFGPAHAYKSPVYNPEPYARVTVGEKPL